MMPNSELKSQKTLITALQKWAYLFPSKIVYSFLAGNNDIIETISYSQLDIKARAIASILQGHKLRGKCVLLAYPTGLDFMSAFIGCLYANVIVVPLNTINKEDSSKIESHLLYIANDTQAEAILTIHELSQAISSILGNGSHKTKLIIDTSSIENDQSTAFCEERIEEDRIAHLQYTSGSTSVAKGIALTHRNMVEAIQHNINNWHYAENSKTLVWTPHSHIFGLYCGLLTPLYHGTPCLIMPSQTLLYRPISWLQAISKYKITHSGGPNFSYEICVDRVKETEIEQLDLSCWKVATNGGELIKKETLERFISRFKKCGFHSEAFCPSYGMSETAGTIATTNVKSNKNGFEYRHLGIQELYRSQAIIVDKSIELSRAFVSVGKKIEGIEIIVVNPETRELVKGREIGELWVRGDVVAQGYWQRPEESSYNFHALLTSQDEPNTTNYLRTGDLGFILEDQVFITGRLKEIIIAYGKNYYPEDIELSALEAHPALKNGIHNAVITVLGTTQEYVILIQEVETDILSQAFLEIVKAIRQRVSSKIGIDLHGVILIEKGSLPKTFSGKKSRALCKKHLQSGILKKMFEHFKKGVEMANCFAEGLASEPCQKGKEMMQKELLNDLKLIFAKELQINISDIHIEDLIASYGGDSISLAMVAISLSDKYGIDIEPDKLFKSQNLLELSNYLLLTYCKSFEEYYKDIIE